MVGGGSQEGVIQAAHVSGFRINFSKKVHTDDANCTKHAGGEGNRLCRYLPANGMGGALIGDMRDLAYIRVLLEVEDKVG